jgi:hypothetical protein
MIDANGDYWLVAPGGESVGIVCLMPDLNLSVNGTVPTDGFTGRLVWSEDMAQICLQMQEGGQSPLNPIGLLIGEFTPLADITMDPQNWVGQEVNVAGWTTGSISPDYDKGYLANGPDYFSRSATIRFQLAGAHAEWIEKGTYIEFFNATVTYDETEGRYFLDVPLYAVGDVAILPDMFSWSGGWDTWTWQINTLVYATGTLNQSEDGTLWLLASGSDDRICLNDDGSAMALGFDEMGDSVGVRTWQGRLVAVDHPDDPGVQLCLTL